MVVVKIILQLSGTEKAEINLPKALCLEIDAVELAGKSFFCTLL